MHELAHIILDLPEDFGYEWTGVHNLRGHLRPDETRRGTRRLCLEPPSSSDRETEKNADGIDYPESGLKAWLVVLGSWCAMMAGLGIVNSTGIFEAYVSNTVLSSSSTNAVGWLLGIYVFVSYFGCLAAFRSTHRSMPLGLGLDDYRFAPSLDIKDGTSAMLVTMLGVLFVEWAYLVPITHVPSYYLVCQDLHGAENAANGEVARSAGSTP
ncbi:hypothetical protein MCOR30_000122 [Pyricularia oryzae]|nr:hypothetical protein MCOR30_000122 [Pyricularia oryzae]